MNSTRINLSRLCTLLLALLLLGSSSAESEEILRVTGSKYARFTLADMAKIYMDQKPELNVQVADMDETVAYEALRKESVDALTTFGPLDEEVKVELRESGVRLNERIIGWGAVVLIVDAKNPLNELSMNQLRKIFAGDYTNWKEVGGADLPIVTITRDEAISGTEKMFRDLMLHGMPMTQKTIRLLDHDVVRAVWKNPGSIADARFTEAVRGRIKGMVKIIALKESDESDAVMPSIETTTNRTYPFSAPLYLYTADKHNSTLTQDFTDFCARRGLGEKLTEHKK